MVENPCNLFVESCKTSPVLHVQDPPVPNSILVKKWIQDFIQKGWGKYKALAERLSLPERIPTPPAQGPAEPEMIPTPPVQRAAEPERIPTLPAEPERMPTPPAKNRFWRFRIPLFS
ncbi:hypothetical protein TNCV_3462751 [Trichonephila clavipes]|nr:hypothetical protein TNCV_3462751 [Trichonephila clavipes]